MRTSADSPSVKRHPPSVIPSFRHSVTLSFRHTVRHPSFGLSETSESSPRQDEACRVGGLSYPRCVHLLLLSTLLYSYTEFISFSTDWLVLSSNLVGTVPFHFNWPWTGNGNNKVNRNKGRDKSHLHPRFRIECEKRGRGGSWRYLVGTSSMRLRELLDQLLAGLGRCKDVGALLVIFTMTVIASQGCIGVAWERALVSSDSPMYPLLRQRSTCNRFSSPAGALQWMRRHYGAFSGP